MKHIVDSRHGSVELVIPPGALYGERSVVLLSLRKLREAFFLRVDSDPEQPFYSKFHDRLAPSNNHRIRETRKNVDAGRPVEMAELDMEHQGGMWRPVFVRGQDCLTVLHEDGAQQAWVIVPKNCRLLMQEQFS